MANEIRVVMSGEDDLSKVVESATRKAERSFDGLADSASGSGKRMQRDFSAGFDALGEGAGGAEQKFIGFKDSITGTSDVMAGLREGNVVLLAQGFADLAGATEALWSSFGKVIVQTGQKIASTAADIASTVANTAATVAHTVASHAAAAASKVWAAAQWVLNAALSANPIALVVIAIAALVAAFILAWKNSETFREVVTAAFDAVKNFIGASIEWIVGRFNWLVDTVTGLPARIWNASIGMFDGIMNAFKSALNWIIDKWNGLSFGIPKLDLGPFGSIGGGTFRVPQIPRFAQGGITSGPMLGIIGDNFGGREAVVPLPPGGGGIGGGHTFIIQTLSPRDAAVLVKRALADADRYGV